MPPMVLAPTKTRSYSAMVTYLHAAFLKITHEAYLAVVHQQKVTVSRQKLASVQNPQTPACCPIVSGRGDECPSDVTVSITDAASETSSPSSPHSHHQLRVRIIYPASQGKDRGQLAFPELAAQDFTCIISFNLHKPYRKSIIT